MVSRPLRHALWFAVWSSAAGCLVINETPDEPAKAAPLDGGAPGPSFIRPDASLRPPDPVDASVSATDSGMQNGMDGSVVVPPNDAGGGVTDASSSLVDAAFVPWDAGPTGGFYCGTWQECPPHYADLNSAYECRANQCECDPDGTWSPQCTSMGGYFNAFDCYCMQDGTAPPSEDDNPDDDCGWEWEYYCEEDTYRDTSRYERRCETISGKTQCRDVWVNSGYWESGGCNHVRWVWKCR